MYHTALIQQPLIVSLLLHFALLTANNTFKIKFFSLSLCFFVVSISLKKFPRRYTDTHALRLSEVHGTFTHSGNYIQQFFLSGER